MGHLISSSMRICEKKYAGGARLLRILHNGLQKEERADGGAGAV